MFARALTDTLLQLLLPEALVNTNDFFRIPIYVYYVYKWDQLGKILNITSGTCRFWGSSYQLAPPELILCNTWHPQFQIPNTSPDHTLLIFYKAYKALEYKVSPYRLLFSWYTLSSRSFLRARMGNCEIKPADGANTFAYLRTRLTSGID